MSKESHILKNKNAQTLWRGLKIILRSLLIYISIVFVHEGYLREEYEERAAIISVQAQDKIKMQSIDSVAYWAIKARNDLKVEIREKGNPISQRLAEQRNLKKYGDPVGPDYQFLEKELLKKGISKENVSQEIIKSAGMANKTINEEARNMKLLGAIFLIAYCLWAFYQAIKLPQLSMRITSLLDTLFAFLVSVLGSMIGVWLFAQVDILPTTEIDTYISSVAGIAVFCISLTALVSYTKKLISPKNRLV
jgi:hypothetical protein